MNIKVYYRRNLKMSEGKLAAQVAHCVSAITLGRNQLAHKVIVLKASDTKFNELKEQAEYIQTDLGYTELEPYTETVLGIVCVD